jgi:hypothetical protein
LMKFPLVCLFVSSQLSNSFSNIDKIW